MLKLSSKTLKSVMDGLKVRPKHYAAVWSPDGTWGRAPTAAEAFTNASSPPRGIVYVLPDDFKITEVSPWGFTGRFSADAEGEAKAAKFDWTEHQIFVFGVD